MTPPRNKFLNSHHTTSNELRAGLRAMGLNNHDCRNFDFMRLEVPKCLREHNRLDPDLRWQAA